MIVKASRVKTSSGSAALRNEVFHGDSNESVQVLQGDEQLVHEMFLDTEATGNKFAVRHMKISPENYSREKIKIAVKKLAEEFGFDVRDVVIVEHTKKRANGSKGAGRHAHVLVPELQNGKIMSSANMFARHEKIARLLELETGETLMKGRHNRAVYHELKKSENFAQYAEKIKDLTFGSPAMSGFSSSQHEKAKRLGISLPEIKNALSGKKPAELGIELAKLEKEGFSFEKGDRKNVVLIKKDGETLGSVSRLAKDKNLQPETIIAALADGRRKLANDERKTNSKHVFQDDKNGHSGIEGTSKTTNRNAGGDSSAARNSAKSGAGSVSTDSGKSGRVDPGSEPHGRTARAATSGANDGAGKVRGSVGSQHNSSRSDAIAALKTRSRLSSALKRTAPADFGVIGSYSNYDAGSVPVPLDLNDPNLMQKIAQQNSYLGRSM